LPKNPAVEVKKRSQGGRGGDNQGSWGKKPTKREETKGSVLTTGQKKTPKE